MDWWLSQSTGWLQPGETQTPEAFNFGLDEAGLPQPQRPQHMAPTNLPPSGLSHEQQLLFQARAQQLQQMSTNHRNLLSPQQYLPQASQQQSQYTQFAPSPLLSAGQPSPHATTGHPPPAMNPQVANMPRHLPGVAPTIGFNYSQGTLDRLPHASQNGNSTPAFYNHIPSNSNSSPGCRSQDVARATWAQAQSAHGLSQSRASGAHSMSMTAQNQALGNLSSTSPPRNSMNSHRVVAQTQPTNGQQQLNGSRAPNSTMGIPSNSQYSHRTVEVKSQNLAQSPRRVDLTQSAEGRALLKMSPTIPSVVTMPPDFHPPGRRGIGGSAVVSLSCASTPNGHRQTGTSRTSTPTPSSGNMMAPVVQRASQTNRQMTRAATPSPLSSSPSNLPQAPTSHMPSLGNGKKVDSNVHSSPARNGQKRATAKSPLSTVSNVQKQTPMTRPRTPNLGNGMSPAQKMPHGQKRQACDIPDGAGQAPKRQATTASFAPQNLNRYQTPTIPQHHASSNVPVNGTKISSSAVSNQQAQLLREQQAYQNELWEQRRLAEVNRLERERRLTRKLELKKDPSALYRHYNEYLEHFPLEPREYRSQYHSRLLANQRMPMETTSDLALAITYAKERWDDFMEYPRDVSRAASAMNAKLERQGN